MRNLKGEKILLIAPLFFGYEKEIVAGLVSRGAEVDFLPDRPFDKPILKAAIRLNRRLVLPYADHFYKKALQSFGRAAYDRVIVIQGEGLSPKFLSWLGTALPTAKFILYMWDSFRNKKALLPNTRYFDKVLTFDPLDAEKHGFIFRPLFFCRGFEMSSPPHYDFDLSFIGTIHSDRYGIISRMKDSLPSSARFYVYMYLQAPWLFYAYKAVNPSFRKATPGDFRFAPLPKLEVQRVFAGSRALLDIEHPSQTGITMRTMEALGAHKKLVTTNAHIRNYDFFDDNNILVIAREGKLKVPPSFFETPYMTIPKVLYEKYSIEGWLDEILAEAPNRNGETT